MPITQGCPCTRKHGAGRGKRARDPENMAQNHQGAVRAGDSLSAGVLGTAGTPCRVAARSSLGHWSNPSPGHWALPWGWEQTETGMGCQSVGGWGSGSDTAL